MMQERLKKLIYEANNGETSRDMPYRYNNLISFGEDILEGKIQLTEKEIIKYLDEYDNYVWDTEKYGGYNFDIAQKLYGLGLKIFEKFNLYKYIEVYHDVFRGYSYSSENQKIKDEYEEFLKIYHAWINAGKPDGEYVKWKKYQKNDFIPTLSGGDFPTLKCEFFITIHFLQLVCILKISHYICSHTQIYMIYKI